MGRKKKKKNNNFRNLGIFALVAMLGTYAYLTFVNGNFTLPNFDNFKRIKNESRIKSPVITDEVLDKIDEVKSPEKRVKIFFIGHSNGSDVYRTVYRVNDSGLSDIEFAVKSLLSGPTNYEREKGIYSEIPQTQLLGVNESADRVAINLSSSFETGGGADSIYKRMFQLIKTVNYNTNKPVYLLINGQLVETLGGEGLMLKQPLNGSSLDD